MPAAARVPAAACQAHRGRSRLLSPPLQPLLLSGRGGCGAVRDTGSSTAGRTAALVRQISNPMASTDCTMLALAGTGHAGGRTFGFASCNRAVGASEGMNVLMRRRTRRAGGRGNGEWAYEYGVTNVEYTEFQRLGIDDVATEAGGTESCFPANTNILYVGVSYRPGPACTPYHLLQVLLSRDAAPEWASVSAACGACCPLPPAAITAVGPTVDHAVCRSHMWSTRWWEPTRVVYIAYNR